MTQPVPKAVHEVHSAPEEVRARIERGLVVMRHLWFTSPAELRAWDRATSKLYVRRLRHGGLEVGPRLANLQAARLCPVVRVAIEPSPEGTRLTVAAPRMPQFAAVLLGIVALLGAAWGGVIAVAAQQGAPAARGWPFWLGLMGFAAGVVALAWGPGRRSLDEALPELLRVAADPDSGGDDW